MAKTIEEFWVLHQKPLIFLLLVGCLQFSYELTNFAFTIDEEVAIRHSSANLEWIKQDRWGMYIASWLLLPAPVVPIIPTFLALLFSSLAFVLIGQAARLNDSVALIAAGSLFIGCPVLFHVYQFSTLGYGVGLGFLLSSLGVLHYLKGDGLSRLIAFVLFTFCIAIYQAFLIYIVVLVFVSWLFLTDWKEGRTDLRLGSVFFLLVFLGASLVAYLLVNWLFLLLADLSSSGYTGGFLNLTGSVDQWQRTISTTLSRIAAVYLGGREIYGSPMPILGILLVVCIVLVAIKILRSNLGVADKLLVLGAIPVILLLPFSLHLINFGRMPARTLISVPLVFSFFLYLAMQASGPRLRIALVSLAALTVLNFAVSNNRFSMQDHLAWNADKALAIRLQVRIDALPVQDLGRIPLEVVGTSPDWQSGVIESTETVASSFFNFNRGNIQRIVFFLDTLSMDSYRVANLQERRSIISEAKNMPVWPEPGSVALINGIVAIKFSDYSRRQLRFLCSEGAESAPACGE